MAYVRPHGNQLTIVHGERDPDTQKVEQHKLFVFYDRPEAEAAVGEHAWQFKNMMEQQHPWVRFDWDKINAGLEKHLDRLPETYASRGEARRERFAEAIASCVEQLVLADPQFLQANAELIEAYRGELKYLQHLIERNLELAPTQRPSRWNQDNEFCWRARTKGPRIPPDAEEYIAHLYATEDYEQLEAACRILLRRFPGWSDGENYLGLIAWDRDELDTAIRHFERASELARRLFPKRLAKKWYWRDHKTRPYVRALHNLANVLNDAGRFEEALEICARLEGECDDDQAAMRRGPIYLNQGQWEEAFDAATVWHQIHPGESFILAFAAYEMDQFEDATTYALHAAINRPRAARMLAGARRHTDPQGYDQVRDHNEGVDLCRRLARYLADADAARGWLRRLIEDERAETLFDLHEDARRDWKLREGPSEGDSPLERMQELESPRWARAQVREQGLDEIR